MALPVVILPKDDKSSDCSFCNVQRITPQLEAIYIIFIVFSHLILLSFYVLLVRGVKQTQMPDKTQPRVNKLVIRIIAVFLLVGFFPLIVRMLYAAARFMKLEYLCRISMMLTFVECFYFFSHCLNPFLYFFASGHHKRDKSTKRNSLFLNDNS